MRGNGGVRAVAGRSHIVGQLAAESLHLAAQLRQQQPVVNIKFEDTGLLGLSLFTVYLGLIYRFISNHI